MKMNSEKNFIIESSPHLHHPDSTARIMLDVIIALVPAGIWGVFVFGVKALIVLAVSVLGAVLGEYIMNKVLKRFTLGDYTAVLTGLLVGYNMPPAVPLYVPFLASLFANPPKVALFGSVGVLSRFFLQIATQGFLGAYTGIFTAEEKKE